MRTPTTPENDPLQKQKALTRTGIGVHTRPCTPKALNSAALQDFGKKYDPKSGEYAEREKAFQEALSAVPWASYGLEFRVEGLGFRG